MFKYLKEKLSVRQSPSATVPNAELQLAAVQGVYDFTSPINYKEAESYLPAVIGCIDFISRSVASLPIRVCRKVGTEKEVITDGAVADLLKAPNPRLVGMTEIIAMTVVDLLAFGNGVILVDEQDGKPILEPIPYGYCTFPYRENMSGYRITYPDNSTRDVPSSQIVHLRINALDGGWIGRSPLARNNNTIALAKLVEQATASLWGNGVYPSLALKTPKSFKSQKEREQARTNLISQLGGNKRGKPLFLDQDFSIEQMKVNSKDLEHMDQRLYGGVVQICTIFGVSPILAAQDYRWGTYSNYDQTRRAWATDGLTIYQKLIGQGLTQKLPIEDDTYIELDSSHLLQSRKEKVDEIVALVKEGILNADEGRMELGYGERRESDDNTGTD